MPSFGSRVRLVDGRTGVVSKVTPDGSDDRVRLDGEEILIDAWQIEEDTSAGHRKKAMRIIESVRQAVLEGNQVLAFDMLDSLNDVLWKAMP
jgi:hypothetical protein